MCQKRQESVEAINKRQQELEQEKSTSTSCIIQLQQTVKEIDTELESIRKSKTHWVLSLLQILKEARREKSSWNTDARMFGKCENCWLHRDANANSDGSFRSAGCIVSQCNCTCHCTPINLSVFVERWPNPIGVRDMIEKIIDDIDSENHTNALMFLTEQEKIDLVGEFAHEMRFANDKYSALICAHWVRVCFACRGHRSDRYVYVQLKLAWKYGVNDKSHPHHDAVYSAMANISRDLADAFAMNLSQFKPPSKIASRSASSLQQSDPNKEPFKHNITRVVTTRLEQAGRVRDAAEYAYARASMFCRAAAD